MSTEHETEDGNPKKETSHSRAKVERSRKRGLLSFRNISILSVIVVGGAIGFEIWKNPDLLAPSKLSRTPNVDATPAGEQLRTSERYQDNLRQQNETGARLAQENNTSFIATPDEPLRQIDDKPPALAPNPNRPLPPGNTPVVAQPPKTVVIERASPTPPQDRNQQPPGPDYQRINQLAQLMASQQQGLLNSWQAQPSGVTVVIDQELYKKPEAQSDDSPRTASPRTGAGSSSIEPDIRAGDVVLASTVITNDSDTPGPVIAEVRRGKLKGARLIGAFQPNQNNTHLIVQFGTAVLPDGSELQIDAYAVDARQKSLAVRTDFDRRLFARYAPRVAAAFVSGLGDALSDTGSTAVNLGNAVGIARPQATFEQGLYKGLAEVGNDLAGEFVQSAPKGPLISLRSRQIIGVLFVANVDAGAR